MAYIKSLRHLIDPLPYGHASADMTTELGLNEVMPVIVLLGVMMMFIVYIAYVDHKKIRLLESLPDGPEKDSAILRAFPPMDDNWLE